MLWVIWVIAFTLTQLTQKAQIWRAGGFGSLGHLGHLDTVLKSARVAVSTCCYSPTKGIPLYKNCQFCFLYFMTQMTQSMKIPSICAASRLGQPSAAPWPNRDPNDPSMQNSHNLKIVEKRG